MRAGKRAAAVMSLIHSAKLNGLDPYAYLRDILERLPTQPASRIAELLPHQWARQTAAPGEGGVETKVGNSPMPVQQISTT